MPPSIKSTRLRYIKSDRLSLNSKLTIRIKLALMFNTENMKIKGKWSRQNFEIGGKNNRFNFYEFGPVSEIALPINWLGHLLRVEWPTILDPTWYLPRVNEWLTFLEDSQIDHFCFPPSLLHFRPPKTFLSKLCTNCYITVSQNHQIVFKLLRGGKSIQIKTIFSSIKNSEFWMKHHKCPWISIPNIE